MTKDERGNWIVRIRCVVLKDVYCDDCTRQEALSRPYDHASDEFETDQEDWEVVSVRSNE